MLIQLELITYMVCRGVEKISKTETGLLLSVLGLLHHMA